MKQTYQPRTYEKLDNMGNRITFDKQAAATADYLGSEQWKPDPDELEKRHQSEVTASISTTRSTMWRNLRRKKYGDS